MDTKTAPTILCIEDNPMNWRLVQRLLSQAGYEMHWAEEGQKGFQMALELKPALILLDINLPGLSGFEVATKLRQQPDLQRTPLVALTAKTLSSDRETALVAGCNGFIPKPIDPFTFVAQVEAYLEGRKDVLESGRVHPALQQFNVQMLEHVEVQLKDAQQANQKMMEVQQALAERNRSLSRLLAFSHEILAERDPILLLRRILEQVCVDVKAEGVCAYRLHRSGSYWEGLKWDGRTFVELAALPKDHAFYLKSRHHAGRGPLTGDLLKAGRVWEEGLSQGFWTNNSECSLIVMKDRQNQDDVWGFWAFNRAPGAPFLAFDQELIALYASMATVAMENAELIFSLNESSRALASSYERIEMAYQDLQLAKTDLLRRDRQILVEELFVKIAKRLETPAFMLEIQSQELDALLDRHDKGLADPNDLCPQVASSIGEIKVATSKINGLLKAMLRRVDKDEASAPEWIDLHDLIRQELEFLAAEAVVPANVEVRLDLQASNARVFGVYGDFARILRHLAAHAFEGTSPSSLYHIRSWNEAGAFHLEATDEGGPIPPTLLDMAFDPFVELHQPPVRGVRSPSRDLVSCRQILTAYYGTSEIRNENDGTVVQISLPIK